MADSRSRVIKDPGYYAYRLREVFGSRDAQMILDRVIALVEAGEDAVQIARRLNG